MPNVKKHNGKYKWSLSSIRAAIPSYRSRMVIIAVGISLGIASILYTSGLARQLRIKESREIELWAYTLEQYGHIEGNDPMSRNIFEMRKDIPFIITDGKLAYKRSNLPEWITGDSNSLNRQVARLARQNEPLRIKSWTGLDYYVFYGRSKLQRTLAVFPFIQITVIFVFILFGFITFRTSEEDEQNKVWIGLAKETAHQLGTPTSSLLGWVEYLKTQPVDQETVAEMDKDLDHLMKITDRFSKIGSDTTLEITSINELVGEAVMYFRKRIPRNVELDYNGLAMAPVKARINPALFEWVIENLLKNALDALQGHGSIDVRLSRDERNIYIDVTDTGRGIARANREKIFEPGFTTKTRGWGLGLSLSRRVVEEYHKGKIFVAESEVGKGTTMRVVIKLIP